MERKETNRANHLPVDSEYIKGVKLIDVDTTIADYMASVIIPDVEENGRKIKVPLIYGNAERWNSARRNGYLRDQRGKTEIPLVMFKRNSVERDASLQHFKDGVTMPAYKSYSKKNRYERFSLQNGVQPVYELYNVAMPSYVTVTYEVMVWTSFTEHMNKIVEAFQYATDRYWGNEDGYKFRARIDSFDTAQEVADGSERVIRTTFSVSVNAYLLAENFNNQPTVKKEFTKKRVVFGVETDLSGTTGQLFTQPSLYNEYKEVIDFVAVRGSQQATYVSPTTVKLTNVRKPLLPSELSGVFDVVNWFRIYINGDFISAGNYRELGTPPVSTFVPNYNYSYNGQLKEILFDFSPLSFTIDENDEILITGKFQEL